MKLSPIDLLGFFLFTWGFFVTVLFWVPRIVNRPLLKQVYGNKFRLIYFIYFSNGPFLLLVGLYLVFFV